MSCEIRTTSRFEKEAKRLIKKYPSLKKELKLLAAKLAEEPSQGVSLGNGFFKIRVAIKSKGKGKSGGGRVISNLITKPFNALADKHLYLASIYDKSELSTIDDTKLKLIATEIAYQEDDKRND